MNNNNVNPQTSNISNTNNKNEIVSILFFTLYFSLLILDFVQVHVFFCLREIPTKKNSRALGTFTSYVRFVLSSTIYIQ